MGADFEDRLVVRQRQVAVDRGAGGSPLLSEPEPRIYVCAASRGPAGVVQEYAKAFARALDPDIVVNQQPLANRLRRRSRAVVEVPR